jgi:transposase-like protein
MSNKSERRTRRKFTDEFKAHAVILVAEFGSQIAKVANELGIYDSSLVNRVRQAQEENAGAPTAEERVMAICSFIAEEQANNSIWYVTEMCRVPLRSRICPIHLSRLRRTLRRPRGAAVDGCDRSVL